MVDLWKDRPSTSAADFPYTSTGAHMLTAAGDPDATRVALSVLHHAGAIREYKAKGTGRIVPRGPVAACPATLPEVVLYNQKLL